MEDAIAKKDGDAEGIVKVVRSVTKREMDRGHTVRSPCYGLGAWKRGARAAQAVQAGEAPEGQRPAYHAPYQPPRLKPLTEDRRRQNMQHVTHILEKLETDGG